MAKFYVNRSSKTTIKRSARKAMRTVTGLAIMPANVVGAFIDDEIDNILKDAQEDPGFADTLL